MKRQIGRLEAQVLAYAQMRGLRTVDTGSLREPLALTATQERKVLSRLFKAKMIARVWRGVYLVPPRLPLGGKWSPGELLALASLMATVGGRYQVCGPNAFNRYGLDEQVPNRLYAYNNRITGERRVGGISLMLIKVADRRLGGVETFRTPDGVRAVFASRVRTLVDAVYDWSRFNGIPRGYRWIRAELASQRVKAEELVAMTLRFGDVGTLRRMGVLLEREGAAPSLLKKLERALPASSSLIPWLPQAPKRGRVNRRWGVIENDRGSSCDAQTT